MGHPNSRHRAAMRRLTSFFAAALAASSLVGFGATTVTASGPPASPGHSDASHGHGHDGTTTTPTVVVPVVAPTVTSTGTTTPATSTSTGSTTGAGAGNITTPNHSGPGDNNHGDVWLQTVGPCPDHNAEVLNHDPDGMACTGDSDTAAQQNAEIGTTESTLPDHNPHLPCANIEVMGKDMADGSSNYSIDYWPPTGDKGGVYGKNSNGSSALTMVPPMTNSGVVGHNGAWVYSAAKGGYQVMDIIDVGVLVANAQAINPDPHDIQGYHFKLQYTQDPQKHKTFWVKCPTPTTPPPTTDCDGDHDGSNAASDDSCKTVDCDGDKDGSKTTDADCGTPAADCDNDHDGSTASDSDCSTPPAQDCDHNTDGSLAGDADCNPGGGTNPGGTTPGGGVTGVLGASTTGPVSGVLGAATTNPVTGHPILSAAIFAALMIVVGGAVLIVNSRRRPSPTT
jgi:hypothetical protein